MKAMFFSKGSYRNSENTLKNLKKYASQKPLGQFQPKLAQSILWCWGFKFVQIKGHFLFQVEIKTKQLKYTDEL